MPETPYKYIGDAAEREMNIHFMKITKRQHDELFGLLQSIADHLGKPFSNSDVVLPPKEKGVLVQELSHKNRRLLDAVLAERYAAENAHQQIQLRNEVAIEECYEEVVSLPEHLNKEAQVSFSDKGFHDACGPWAGRERIHCLRRTVADRVRVVCRALNAVDLMMHIEDCWRPPEVQKGLLIRRIIQIAKHHPDWSYETVKMVSMSLTAASPGLAGHQAAAAIDWRLRHLQGNQDFLPLGNKYAEGSVISSLDCPYVTFPQLFTRIIFEFIMEAEGFKLLRTENWHGSVGDRGAGADRRITMKKAVYGPIESFDFQDGSIVTYPNDAIEEFYLIDDEIQMIADATRDQVLRLKKPDEHVLKHVLRKLEKRRI